MEVTSPLPAVLLVLLALAVPSQSILALVVLPLAHPVRLPFVAVPLSAEHPGQLPSQLQMLPEATTSLVRLPCWLVILLVQVSAVSLPLMPVTAGLPELVVQLP